MNMLVALFFGSLLLGQIGGISVWPGVVFYTHDFVLAILITAVGIRMVMRKKVIKPSLVLPIGAFIAAVMLSLVGNSGQFQLLILGISSLYLVRWIFYALLYVVVMQRFVQPAVWLAALYATGVGFGILGIIQFYLYPDLRNLYYLGWDPHFYRLFSTLLDPNFAGIILVLTFLLGCAFWTNKKFRVWIITGEFIAFTGLLLTYSRSSYLAFAGALILWAVLRKQWKIIAGFLLFGGIVLFLPRTEGSTLSLLRADSAFARVGNWKEGISLLQSAPVFGHGFDTLRYTQGKLADSEIISKSAAGLDSSVLFIGATTGVIGMAAYGYLIFSMVRIGIRAFINKRTTHIGLAYLTSFAALGIHSLFTNSMFYPWILVWFWVLVGAMERVVDPR